MPASLQTVSAVLKERYEDKMNSQINNDVQTLRRIERSSDGVSSDIGGKYVVFPIHTRRNSGIGARNEGEVLPNAGQQGLASGRIPLRYQYGAMELTGQTFELVEKNAKAFVNAVDLETNGLKNDLAKDLNRQIYGDGSGALAAITGGAWPTFNVADLQYVELDMMVDVYAADGTTLLAADRQVVSYDEDANTLTLSGAAPGTAPGAGATLSRTRSRGKEWTGLSKIVNNTGPLFNLDPTIEPKWKSVVNHSDNPRAISETLMITHANKIRKNGGKTSVIFTNPGVWVSYWQLLAQQRQFVNTTEFTGGFKGLAFVTENGEIPVMQDFDAPAGKMFFLNESDIKVYREHDWKWMNRDGSMFQRKITAEGEFDAYTARMYQYSEIGIHQRNTHGVIDNLIETK